MKRLSFVFVLIGLWVTLLALACNLSGGSEPPTLVPRASPTPPPTIGYATLSPEQLPEQAVTSVPQADVTLLNLLNQISADRLMTHVESLVNMGTRHVNSSYNSPGYGIGAAQTYIEQQFVSIRNQYPAFSIIKHTFGVDWAGAQSAATNIVGVLPGREVGGGVIVLCAHYDSITLAVEDGTALAPGANDNASGVAALLELARVMSSRPQQPRATVMFIAFSAEEIGRVGSKAFINDYIRPYGIAPQAVINLDIIGSQTGPDGSIDDRRIRVFSEGPNESPSRQLARGLNLLTYNQAPNMELIIEDAVDRSGRYGDHMSFSEAGYPAVRFIEPLEDVARHHTERDTMDDIQAAYLTRVTQTLLAVTLSLSDGPRAPRNITLRDSGGGIRTLVWEPATDAVSYVVALRRPGSLIYDQFFETPQTTVSWDGFTVANFAGLAIAGKTADGMLGPVSAEYFITS